MRAFLASLSVLFSRDYDGFETVLKRKNISIWLKSYVMSHTQTSICLAVIMDFLAKTARSVAEGYALCSKYFSRNGTYSWFLLINKTSDRVTERTGLNVERHRGTDFGSRVVFFLPAMCMRAKSIASVSQLRSFRKYKVLETAWILSTQLEAELRSELTFAMSKQARLKVASEARRSSMA
jgi:hypothetical protein